MPITINGSTGISGVDGSSATPALQGTDTNTGISYGTDIVTINTGGTARVTTDASGNVGIGTSSPASKLHVSGSFRQTGATVPFEWTVNSGAADFYKLNAVGFADNLIVANSSGNVGIGTVSPTSKLSVNGVIDQISQGTASAQIRAVNTGGTFYHGIDTSTGASFGSAYAAVLWHSGAYPMIIATRNAEKMRLTSDGNLLVGTTSIPTTSNGFGVYNFGTIVTGRSTTSTAGHHEFRNPNGLVGQIVTDGSSTTYSTASDYRLKENIASMQNALATVAALKPCTYTWKADGSDGQGFIAHELQAVVPDCVTGTKDAVDKDGKPQYQGVDTSFLVATLVAAIQEQQALIQSLTTRLNTLEGN